MNTRAAAVPQQSCEGSAQESVSFPGTPDPEYPSLQMKMLKPGGGAQKASPLPES